MQQDYLANLLEEMTAAARIAGLNDSAWARRARLPKETLCRLRRRRSCDFATLQALAEAIDLQWGVRRPADATPDGLWPREVDRALERRLLDLVASGSLDPIAWRAVGPGFFVAGLAVMLASVTGFPRAQYLALAEALHPGATELSVFRRWLAATPLPPVRFLLQVRAETAVAG